MMTPPPLPPPVGKGDKVIRPARESNQISLSLSFSLSLSLSLFPCLNLSLSPSLSLSLSLFCDLLQLFLVTIAACPLRKESFTLQVVVKRKMPIYRRTEIFGQTH
jgi:hypothetical protein